MKIDRLMGILTFLLQNEKTNLSVLAEKFEVSERTVRRDIESLCQAGIPIVSLPGYKGGIAVMEGYKIDHTVFTAAQLQSVLSGLKGLNSIWETGEVRSLMEKFRISKSSGAEPMYPDIDLASNQKWALAPRISQIQNAVRQCRLLSFDYYAPGGEGRRTVEPYQLVYRWSSWYLWGYCMDRGDFRLFKLKRMDLPELLETRFAPREDAAFEARPEHTFQNSIDIVAVADPSAKWRIVEEMGVGNFEELEDGGLLFQRSFTDKDTLFHWVLSFGKQIRLLSPPSLCRELHQQIVELEQMYR